MGTDTVTKSARWRRPTWWLVEWGGTGLIGLAAWITWFNVATWQDAGCHDQGCYDTFQRGQAEILAIGVLTWVVGFIALSLVWIMTWLARYESVVGAARREGQHEVTIRRTSA